MVPRVGCIATCENAGAAYDTPMAIETFDGISPSIAESAYVARSADVIGRVSIGEEASVWYNTTLRGDIHEIVIGPRSNVQDNAVVHLEPGGQVVFFGFTADTLPRHQRASIRIDGTPYTNQDDVLVTDVPRGVMITRSDSE